MVDIGQEEEAPNMGGQTVGAPPPAQAGTSPLIKLIETLTGKKKGPAAAVAPATAEQGSVPDTPPAAARMPSGPLMMVMTRNEFYRDGFRNLLRIAFVQAVVIVGLIMAFIYYMSTAVSEDRYFATTADGRIMQLVPLGQANMEVAALLSWVSSSSAEIMTFSYHDYQRRLQQSSRHFTRRGWETFTAALQKSRILQGVQEYKQVVSSVPRAAPTLIRKGVVNGKYRWIVKLPLQVRYEGNANRTDNLDLTLVIERVPSLENPNGVGIEQWIATAAGEG